MNADLTVKDVTRGTTGKGQVTVQDGALFIDGQAVDPANYALGYIQPEAGIPQTRVHLMHRVHGRTLELIADNIEQARALLEALGLGGNRHMISFNSTYLPLAVAGFVLMVVALSCAGAAKSVASIPLGVLALALFVLSIVVSVFARHPVKVAPDGIIIEHLGRRRMIAYSELKRARPTERSGVLLELESGELIRLSFENSERINTFIASTLWRIKPSDIDKGLLGHRGRRVRDAVLLRINEAINATHDDALAGELSAAGRDANAWLGHITRMRRGDLRTAKPPREKLWHVVENGGAHATARAAAALILRDEIKDAERKRLRIAADSVAAPKLRVALDVIADAEEEAALAALSQLDDDYRTLNI